MIEASDGPVYELMKVERRVFQKALQTGIGSTKSSCSPCDGCVGQEQEEQGTSIVASDPPGTGSLCRTRYFDPLGRSERPVDRLIDEADRLITLGMTELACRLAGVVTRFAVEQRRGSRRD